MKSTNNFVKKGKKAIQDDLRREYVLSSKDETFMKLCARQIGRASCRERV